MLAIVSWSKYTRISVIEKIVASYIMKISIILCMHKENNYK